MILFLLSLHVRCQHFLFWLEEAFSSVVLLKKNYLSELFFQVSARWTIQVKTASCSFFFFFFFLVSFFNIIFLLKTFNGYFSSSILTIFMKFFNVIRFGSCLVYSQDFSIFFLTWGGILLLKKKLFDFLSLFWYSYI